MVFLLAAAFAGSAAQAQVLDPVFANQFEEGAASLSPALSYARAGAGATTGIGAPITLTLMAPVATNTFVPISSSNPSVLTVAGGGTTVLSGQSSATVSVTALAESATPVVLTASLGNQVSASVRALGAMEVPGFVISPTLAHVAPGGTRQFTLVPTIPPPPGGTQVDITISPPGAGTATPNLLNFPVDSFAAQTFDYTDNNAAASIQIAADAVGSSGASANVVVAPVGKLVINEVDYDQPVSDNAEFIEIYNRSPDIVPLAGLSVVLINGVGNAQLASYDLATAAAQLNPGQYLVLRDTGVTLPGGTPFIDFPNPSENIQNGAPDGMAIVDVEAQSVIDALSYEGSVTGALITGFTNAVSLVEGAAMTAIDTGVGTSAVARLPNGVDANNADVDFALTPTPTPGTANFSANSHLVINEVDYDQSGVDSASFIEIYNPTANAVALAGFAVVLINGGANNEYARYDLSVAGASLPAGGYLVVRNSTVTVPGGVLTMNISGDFIQNGPPDGLALINTSNSTLVDALSYEGSITAASIMGFAGTVNLVEGTAFAGSDTNDNLNSLARTPNGNDSDNAVSDWTVQTVITPGAANP